MYLQYFGLKENPFALPPDPRYLYLGVRHQEALAHLLYGINEGGGFVQLTGEVGTGKTMTVRALIERLPGNVDVALVLYPFLSVNEFVAAICDEIGVPLPMGEVSLKSMIDALNAFLLENHAKGRRTVLIVDEAHKLSLEVLEQIRLLTNLETTKEKLLQIVLVGQPELIELLARQDLRQLAQRITTRYNLRSLLWEESTEYVLHRCRVAGAQLPLFSRTALRAVHRLSGGIPRLINVVCDRALLGAYATGKMQVTPALVRRAMAEVGPPTKSWLTPPVWAGAATGLAIILIAVGVWQFWPWTPRAGVIDAVAAPQTTTSVPATGNAIQTSLDKLLADETVPTDTDTAFARLFSHWQRDYLKYQGATGCDRATESGLRCIFESGTWNNIRQINRPAIIELTDAAGGRHHVLVTALARDSVTLELGDRPREFALTDVDRFWFGKYLALWNPPESGERVLREGMVGPSILWLRDTLTRAGLVLTPPEDPELFDTALELKVKEFQRLHNTEEDGVVGRMTLILLSSYDKVAPPLLAANAKPAVVPK
jgi:general secretion pathway protein A